jgi:hypothetical protein
MGSATEKQCTTLVVRQGPSMLDLLECPGNTLKVTRLAGLYIAQQVTTQDTLSLCDYSTL